MSRNQLENLFATPSASISTAKPNKESASKPKK